MAEYVIDDEEGFQDFQQFYLASSLYWALMESHASEMSARRTAMENATKNAGIKQCLVSKIR